MNAVLSQNRPTSYDYRQIPAICEFFFNAKHKPVDIKNPGKIGMLLLEAESETMLTRKD